MSNLDNHAAKVGVAARVTRDHHWPGEGGGRAPMGDVLVIAPGPGRDPRESRTIANHFTRVVSGHGEEGLRIEWGWRGCPWLRFWNAQARTDISGVSPTTGRQIGEVIRAHLDGVFER